VKGKMNLLDSQNWKKIKEELFEKYVEKDIKEEVPIINGKLVDSKNWKEIKRYLPEEIKNERERLLNEAKKLYENINLLGKMYDGLYKSRLSSLFGLPPPYLRCNALMGIFAYLLGEKKEAEELYVKINQKFRVNKTTDKYNGLYKCGTTYREILLSDNALMGIFLCLLGKKDEAEEVYKKINERFRDNEITSKYNGLYVLNENNPVLQLSSNALMGIFLCLLRKEDEAKELYEKINERFKISDNSHEYKGMYLSTNISPAIYTIDNALMGIFLSLLGRKKEAIQLYTNIKEKLKNEEGLYRYDSVNQSTIFLGAQVLVGILSCLIGRFGEAQAIYEKINEIFKGNKLYKQWIIGNDVLTSSNALVGIFTFLLASRGRKTLHNF